MLHTSALTDKTNVKHLISPREFVTFAAQGVKAVVALENLNPWHLQYAFDETRMSGFPYRCGSPQRSTAVNDDT